MGQFEVTHIQRPGLRENLLIERHDQTEPLEISGQTSFKEVSVAEFTPLVELDSSNGLSPERRDTSSTTGTGSVSNSEGEHLISTGTTSGSTASLRTKERGRYQPGTEGLPGIAVRRPAAPTGDAEWRAGYFDDEDGMWFGEDATGYFVQYRHRGTTEAKIYQANWNGKDRFDGEGPSGTTINLTSYQIIRFPFVWYGAGPIRVELLTVNDQGDSFNTVVHSFDIPSGEPVLSQPKLPVNAEVDNGTTTQDLELYIGGRQFAIHGRYTPNVREVPEIRRGASVAAGTTEPLISFQQKSDRISQGKPIQALAASLLTDQPGILKIYVNPTLTGASFGSLSEVDATETSLEADVSATAISGGLLIRASLVSAGGPSRASLAAIGTLPQDIPDNTIVTLAFENLGNQAAAVDSVFEIREEW